MARRITTDTFLTITGPGINIKVCRALADPAGNVAVWWKPNGAPQRMFTVGKDGIKMRGQMTTPDGITVAYRRRGVSCTWAICKGKFNTRQVAAWWPETGAAGPAPVAAAKVAPARTAPAAPVRRTRPVTVAERRAARARARAARVTRATVAERRANAAKAAEEITETADKLDRALGGPGLEQTSDLPEAPPAAEERVTEYALNPETLPDTTPQDRMEHLELPDATSPDPAPSASPATEVAEPEAPKNAVVHEWSEADGLVTQTIVTPTPKPKPPTNAEYRAWARDNGYTVSSRGPIPDEIRAAFASAREA